MNKLHVSTGLIFGVGVVGASAMPGNDLEFTQTRDNTTRSVFKNTTAPTDFSGGVAGVVCIYDNYNPLDDFGSPCSQKDPVQPFYAEAADDFTLPGDPANDCRLTDVIFGVTWFNGPGGETPFACWTGVNITIYEDAADFCGPGFLKGPAGEPLDPPPQGHIEYCPGAVKCEIKKDLSHVSSRSLTNVC